MYGDKVMTSTSNFGVDDDRPMLSRRDVVTAGLTTGAVALTAAVISAAAAEESTDSQKSLRNIKALTFDVFGTVVDWRSSVIREGQLLSGQKVSTQIGRRSRMHGAQAMVLQ